MRKTIKIAKDKNLVHPASIPFSEAELVRELKKAEKGNFISVLDGMKDFGQWVQSKENK